MLDTKEKEPDQKRIVASLASEYRLPIGEMATLYEHQRAQLALDANITKYIHIFAIRKVREIVLQRGLDKQPSKLAGLVPVLDLEHS